MALLSHPARRARPVGGTSVDFAIRRGLSCSGDQDMGRPLGRVRPAAVVERSVTVAGSKTAMLGDEAGADEPRSVRRDRRDGGWVVRWVTASGQEIVAELPGVAVAEVAGESQSPAADGEAAAEDAVGARHGAPG